MKPKDSFWRRYSIRVRVAPQWGQTGALSVSTNSTSSLMAYPSLGCEPLETLPMFLAPKTRICETLARVLNAPVQVPLGDHEAPPRVHQSLFFRTATSTPLLYTWVLVALTLLHNQNSPSQGRLARQVPSPAATNLPFS